MNEGNVCEHKRRREADPRDDFVSGETESQIKNHNCVLVTHFRDVFPEFSIRCSVDDILNTFQ